MKNMSWEFSMLLTRNLGRNNKAIALVGQVEREFWALQVRQSSGLHRPPQEPQ